MENIIRTSLKRLGKLGSAIQQAVFNLTDSEVRLVEFQNSSLLILWAIWLAFLPPTHLIGTGEVLAQLGPSVHFWTLLCGILGVTQAITGFRRTPVQGRILTAFLSSLFWGFLMVASPMAEPGKTIVPTYFVLTITQAVVYLRLSLGEEKNKINGRS